MDKSITSVRLIFEETYGKESTTKWIAYWRTFFISVAELFGYNNGDEWMVAHYLFRKKQRLLLGSTQSKINVFSNFVMYIDEQLLFWHVVVSRTDFVVVSKTKSGIPVVKFHLGQRLHMLCRVTLILATMPSDVCRVRLILERKQRIVFLDNNGIKVLASALFKEEASVHTYYKIKNVLHTQDL